MREVISGAMSVRPDLPVAGAAVGEDGRGARQRDHVHRGDVGEGRDDDLVAGADVEAVQGEVESGRPVAHADRVLDAGEALQRALELVDIGAD